jgi:hypothetical protein
MLITRDFLRSVNFRVMTDFDRHGFAGANSPVALIGETGNYLVVVDGNYCEVYDADPTGDGTFEPIETNDNICELPY